jgi:hypothetical protein
VDLLGTGAFALSVIPQLLDPSANARVKLSASFVALWATKLPSFLFYRVIKNKHDGRLDGTLSSVSGAGMSMKETLGMCLRTKAPTKFAQNEWLEDKKFL